MEDEDLFEGLQVAPDVAQLSSLSSLVKRATALGEAIEGLEAALKAHKAELLELQNKHIPDALAAAGLSDFKTEEGLKVEVKDYVNGSLPKDAPRRAAALKWLEENGAAPLLRETFTLELEVGEREEADIAAALHTAKMALKDCHLDFEEKLSVHPQTLYAFVRERLRNGMETPVELLGLYVGRAAKITPPKEKK